MFNKKCSRLKDNNRGRKRTRSDDADTSSTLETQMSSTPSLPSSSLSLLSSLLPSSPSSSAAAAEDVGEVPSENIICDIPDLTCTESISPTPAVYYDIFPAPVNYTTPELKFIIDKTELTYDEFIEYQNNIPKYFVDSDSSMYDVVWTNLLEQEKIEQQSLFFNKEKLNEHWTKEMTESYYGLSLSMRDLVVGWMQEVCMEEKCDQETFYLSCLYLDTLVCQTNVIDKSNLQKYAATCMLIASKFKQTYFIHPVSLFDYTDRSIYAEEILECEMEVVELLEWDFSHLTPHPFMTYLLYKLLPPTSSPDDITRVRRHAATFMDLSITCTKFSKFRQSQLACACILLSISGLYSGVIAHDCFNASLAILCNKTQESESFVVKQNLIFIVRELGEMFQSKANLSSQTTDQVTFDPSLVIIESSEDITTTPKHLNPLPTVKTSTPSDAKEVSLNS